MKKILLFALALSLPALGMQLHSKVEVKAKDKALEFKLVPDSGLVLNSEGPWKLEILEAHGFEAKEKVQLKDKFDVKTGSVSLQLADVPAKGAVVKFKLVGFVCTADKTKCYRDVHTQETKL